MKNQTGDCSPSRYVAEVSEAWPVMPVDNVNGQIGQGAPPPSPGRSEASKVSGLQLFSQILDQDAVERGGRKKHWIQTTRADFFFGGWIVVNALILAIETDSRTEANEKSIIWFLLDSIFNVVFLVEMMLRMRAERRRWIKDVWNLFDAMLVTVGVFDTWILPLTGMDSDIRFLTLIRLFRLLRLVRVLRVLRLLRFLKELMLLVQGITSAMRAMVWGLLLLGITIFICSLLITRLIGKSCCEESDTFQDALYASYFGTLSRTAFTLFQFTMEFQPDICRETWAHGPWLTFFFLAYTMFTNITLLNTVASVIVENILSIAQQNQNEEKAKAEADEVEKNHERMQEIYNLLDVDGNKMIDRAELSGTDPAVDRLLELSGVTKEDAMRLFSVMDVDDNGQVSRDEFQNALARGKSSTLGVADVLRVQCQVDALKQKMSSTLGSVSEQNTKILEVMTRLEARQESLEDTLASARQPDARDLDDMSCRFVPQRKQTRERTVQTDRPLVLDELPLSWPSSSASGAYMGQETLLV
jgi:voltage-gated sodium channel